MHLHTVNRDQRRESLPRQRGEEAEETAPFFSPSLQKHCEYSFVSCLPTPPFYIAKFLEVLCFFYSPSAFPSQNTFCIGAPSPHSSSSSSFTLHFLIFLSPTGSPDDTTAATLLLSFCFPSWHMNFLVLTLLQRGFKAAHSAFPVFNVYVQEKDTQRA